MTWKSDESHRSELSKYHDVISYRETKDFPRQFCLHNQSKVRTIEKRSDICLVSITRSKGNEVDAYLQERQTIISRFQFFLTKKLQADRNLSLDSFRLLRQLGAGGYGSVFLAYHTDTNEYLALKAIQKSALVETNEQNIVLSERQYAFALQHPNIVQLLTSFKDNEFVYLAFEWLQGGDLYSLISHQKLTELQGKFYAAQIVMALDYLHGCKVVFRDLKPENIVLTRRGYAKLIDLGLAKLIRGYSKTFCGTPHYIAPEVIMQRPYTVSPDYWSLGIIIHEMVTGDAPYDRTYEQYTDSSESESVEIDAAERSMSTIENETIDIIRPSSKHYNMYLRIINGCSSMNLNHLSRDCAELIRSLLQYNVEQRLGCGLRGAMDVLEHCWFRGLNFWMLYQQKYLAPFLPIRKSLLTARDDDDTVLRFTAKNDYEKEFVDF